MVIKLYVSGISGNKEVKKKQQRVQMILDSKQIIYETIDITEPGKEKEKEFMQQNGKVRENLGKHPLPPQIFNEDDFCGDYEDFDMANEVDELEKFLHIECPKILDNESKQNEKSRNFNEEQISDSGSTNSSYNLYDYHTFKVKWDGVNGLQEQIIDSTTGDFEQAEEVEKSEVNGVVEEVTTSNENDSDSGPKASVEDVSSLIKEEVKNEESESVDKDLPKEVMEGISKAEISTVEEVQSQESESVIDKDLPKELIENEIGEDKIPPSEEVKSEESEIVVDKDLPKGKVESEEEIPPDEEVKNEKSEIVDKELANEKTEAEIGENEIPPSEEVKNEETENNEKYLPQESTERTSEEEIPAGEESEKSNVENHKEEIDAEESEKSDE